LAILVMKHGKAMAISVGTESIRVEDLYVLEL
jgi:hypothetical protein